VECICTVGIREMLGARGYVEMHMENIEHAYNMHIYIYIMVCHWM
jgi:hypothetical protein